MNPESNRSSTPDPPSRWVKIWDYTRILLVFAVTGTTAAIVPRYMMPLTGLTEGIWYGLVYFLLITPIYQVLLLGYAFLFGKFSYFYEKEKKVFRWLGEKLGIIPSE